MTDQQTFQVTQPNLVALVRAFRAALEHCPRETAAILDEAAMPHVKILNDAIPKDEAK